jgi:hypothetical protein
MRWEERRSRLLALDLPPEKSEAKESGITVNIQTGAEFLGASAIIDGEAIELPPPPELEAGSQ